MSKTNRGPVENPQMASNDNSLFVVKNNKITGYFELFTPIHCEFCGGRICIAYMAGVPVISLAKSEEEVFVSGVPFPLPFGKKTRANMYLQEIRDEAHRFAVEYNRLLRKKRVVGK